MRNDLAYLRHMLDSIGRIERYTKGASFAEFAGNEQMAAATCRELEIIGEAANNIGDDFRKSNPSLPWSDMVAMRNFLIHEYFGVTLERVWSTVVNSLPSLKSQLEPLVEKN